MSRPGQAPVSFKTVPGRNKTQKWQQAKSYNYDGDDWGALDEFDEYTGYDDPPPPPHASASATQQRYASEPPIERHRPHRQNSFDAGVDTERRQFSGPAGFAQHERRGSPAPSSSSGSRPSQDYLRGPGIEHDRRRERNFTNPEQVPPPLTMRGAPASTPASAPVTGLAGDSHAFPPRKSSISSLQETPPVVPAAETMPTAKSPSTDKPLPFIRPSDIYKRIEEEKERERGRASMDFSRPSMDSIPRAKPSPQGRSATDSPASGGVGRRPSMGPASEEQEPLAIPLPMLPPLELSQTRAEVAAQESPEIEGHGSQLPEYKPLSSLESLSFGEPQDAAKKASPVLPQVSRISGFGSDFLHDYTESSSRTAEGFDTRPREQHVQSTISRVMNAPVVNPDAPSTTQFGSTQATPATSDHQSDRSIDGLAENQSPPSELQHHGSDASQGFRSVVNTAFDRKDDSSVPTTPISRDNSQASSGPAGVGRSDTTSTAGISPIMSRVPSAATAQQRQQDRAAQVPPIAEESTPTQSRSTSAAFGTILPGSEIGHHNREGSGSSIVQAGYRRSLQPPSHGSSPSRTPGYETVESRRLSEPLSAVTVNEAEAPDVADQANEVPGAHLQPGETPARDGSQSADPQAGTRSPPPATGRRRSDTDYCMREADIARDVNPSPHTPSYSPPIAQDAQYSQREFLRNHASGPSGPSSPMAFGRPVSPNIAAAGLGIARSTTPGSMTGVGPDSPAKGRVREIAGNYNILDEASRRNSNASSKSSWSNFGRSEENLSLRRKGTGLSQMESGNGEEAMQNEDEMFRQYDQGYESNIGSQQAASGISRPNVESQQSFRPHLPGQWVSYAPTPVSEEPPRQHQTDALHDEALTPPASKVPDETVDLTPTTKKSALMAGDVIPTPGEEKPNTFDQVKDAGAALGESLMTAAGLTSQARDFGSTVPLAPVEQPEMRSKLPSGAMSGYLKPRFARQESEATSVVTSVASSVPPTPPIKDPPKSLADGEGATPLNSNLAGLEDVEPPISGYFSGADLSPGTDREREEPGLPQSARPQLSHGLGTATDAGDFESDRLRKEIVRSLDPIQSDEVKRKADAEDTERTQDALEPPDSGRRSEHGIAPASAAETQKKPMLLDQRFSWEQAPILARTDGTSQHQHKPQQSSMLAPGEIAPEAPYERPRSRGLHIMNADSDKDESPVEEENAVLAQQDPLENSAPLPDAVSPASPSQENPRESISSSAAGDGMQHVEPSAVVVDTEKSPDLEGVKLPSYYQSDAARSTMIPRSPPLPQSPTPEPLSNENASPQRETSTSSMTAPNRESSARIPPFREILSIKDTGDRIKTYNDTRQTFSSMDTGLSAWLSSMLEKHSEHADLTTRFTCPSPAGGGRLVHRHSPSIMKMGNSLGGGSDRKGSLAGASGVGESPSREGGLDMEKMGQRGKDLMNRAGLLGGKAGKGMMAGGKGLFAKSKSRFGTLKGRDAGGGDKALPYSPPSSFRAAATSSQPLSPSHQPSAATAFPPAAEPPASREESYTPPSLVQENVTNTPVRPLSPGTRAARVGIQTLASAVSDGGSGGGVEHRHGFSQAFERLRERSRSKHGRSRSSRPQSLVLDAGSEDRSSPTANIARVATELSLSNLRRIESCNHPNAEFVHSRATESRFSGVGDLGNKREEGEEAERLGVLPSPAAEEYAEFIMIGDVKAARGHREVSKPTTTVDENVAPVQPLFIRKLRRDGKDSGGQLNDTSESERSSSAPARPLHERKNSALAGLPSQQHFRQFSSPVDPGVLPFILPSENEGRITTQLASKAASLPFIAKHAVEEEDDLYCSTPMAAKALNVPWERKTERPSLDMNARSEQLAEQQTSAGAEASLRASYAPSFVTAPANASRAESRLGTSGNEADRMSAISAEDRSDNVAHDKALDFGSADSRRSSVSSIGSPDTTVGKRASMIVSKRQENAARERRLDEHPIIGSVAHRGIAQAAFAGKPSIVQLIMQPPVQRPTTAPTVEQQRFMNRSYRSHKVVPPGERPMSFVPAGPNAPQDQDTLGTVDESRATKSTEDVDQVIPEPDSGGAGTIIPVDVSALAGPPVGAPPFMQHPLFRNSVANVQLTEHEKLRMSPAGMSTQATHGHARHKSEPTEKRRSKRFSGFFSKKQEETKENAPYTTLPNPSALNDPFGVNDHGLEDMTPRSEVPPEIPENETKKAKRMSGIWDSIRPSPAVSKTNVSSQSSVSRVVAIREGQPSTSSDALESPVTSPAKSRVLLRKPQRSASSATPSTEAKQGKQRFPMLGRIFGRSKTQGRSMPKPNKLIKLQQPHASGREGTFQRDKLDADNTAGRQNRDHADYEATRKQQSLDIRIHQDDSPVADLAFDQPPADLDDRGVPVLPKANKQMPPAETVESPPEGWYAPGRDHDEHKVWSISSISTPLSIGKDSDLRRPSVTTSTGSSPPRLSPTGQQPQRDSSVGPQRQERPAHFRRLHSEGFRRALQQARIPEAFRPVEASYGIQAKPIGPPSQYQPPFVYQPPNARISGSQQQPTSLFTQPSLPTRQPYWGQAPPQSFASQSSQLPWDELRERQYSDVSAVSAASQPGPQFDAGPERMTGRDQGIRYAPKSPAQSRQASETALQPQLPQPQTQQSRTGSVGEEVARSPAKAYADQQTPYAFSLRGDAFPPRPREESWRNPPGSARHGALDPRHNEARHYTLQPGLQTEQDPNYLIGPAEQQSFYPSVSASLLQQPYTMATDNPLGQSRIQMQHRPDTEGRPYPSRLYTPPTVVHYQQTYQTDASQPLQREQTGRYCAAPREDSYGHYQQIHQASYGLPPPAAPPRQHSWSPPHTRAPDSHRPPPRHMGDRYYGPVAPESRALTYQRTPSGYSGRRHDAAVSEQEVDAIMRGVSYPGQEWAPRVYE